MLIPFYFLTANVNSSSTSADYESLLAEGKSTKGILEGIDIVYNVNVNNEHPAIITYSYGNGGNTVIDKYQTFAPDKIELLEIGQEVEVRFSDQSSVLVDFPPYAFPVHLIGLIFLIFPAIGLPFLIILIYQVSNELKLYRKGNLTRAVVLSMDTNKGLAFTDFGKSKSVTYEFTEESGKSHIGTSRTSDFSITGKKQIGDEVKVLVLPDHPSKSCLWPVQLAEKLNWK